MKKAAVILYGLPRTFKTTSNSLFDSIILPNMKDYDIDILINTDFEGHGITRNRPDTHSTGISTYNYTDHELFIKDLVHTYNRCGQLKDIQIYNNREICLPWMLIIKRVEQILVALHSQSKKYDCYIMIRMDIVFTNILYFSDVEKGLIFLTGSFTRSSFIHNRDWFDCVAANYDSFMIYIYGFRKLFHKMIVHSPDEKYETFYTMGTLCSLEISISDDVYIHPIELSLRMVDTECELEDIYHEFNSINFSRKYNMPHSILKKEIYKIFNSILHRNTLVLGEYNIHPIHYTIVR